MLHGVIDIKNYCLLLSILFVDMFRKMFDQKLCKNKYIICTFLCDFIKLILKVFLERRLIFMSKRKFVSIKSKCVPHSNLHKDFKIK